jgi:hypothetical protein
LRQGGRAVAQPVDALAEVHLHSIAQHSMLCNRTLADQAAARGRGGGGVQSSVRGRPPAR